MTARDHYFVSPLINGERIASASDAMLEVRSPSTGEPLFSYPAGSNEDAHRAVQAARCAFDDGIWHQAPPSRRRAVLERYADLIEDSARQLDALDAEEMGKPISVAFCNAAAGAAYVRYCAGAFDKLCGDVFVSDAPSYITQRRVPLGVVAAIASWNFPTFVAVLKTVPALAVGNSVVLKPAEISPRSALLLAELAATAGIPKGVFNVTPGVGDIVGRALALHSNVDMVTFTGSTKIGKQILEYAGQSNMKRVLLECGGKSPHVVFPDCELDETADAIAAGILRNQGQVCSAGTRVIVHRAIETALAEKLAIRFHRVTIGDPLNTSTTFGPLSSISQRLKVEGYIATAIEAGAELVSGGKRALPDSGGYFIEPTLFKSVQPDARIAREEIFGPVLPLISFETEHEAISIANSTDYGLSATIWCNSIKTSMRMAKQIRSSVSVRTGSVRSEGAQFAPPSEPAAQSGFGVEGGLAGLESYQRRQTISFMHG